MRNATLFRLRLSARLGWREFRAFNPSPVLAGAAAPRLLLQTPFLVALAGLAGDRQYAFVGALAVGLTLFTTIGVCDVPMHDKDSDTFWRLRTGAVNPFGVVVARVWPYPVVALAGMTAVLVLTAPLLGFTALGVRLIVLLPLYALMSMTSTALGLTGALLAVGRRSDVLAGNLLAYLLMVSSGALVPAGQIGWLDAIGAGLPLWHGLHAVRAALTDAPFIADVLREAAVGAGWFLVAWTVFRIQVHRARRSGHDHYA